MNSSKGKERGKKYLQADIRKALTGSGNMNNKVQTTKLKDKRQKQEDI